MANHKKKKKLVDTKEKAVLLDLFYMTPSEVTIKEMADFLKESGEVMVDYWEEMEVFEIGRTGLEPITFEKSKVEFVHPSDLAFIKNRGIKNIFVVTAEEKALEGLKDSMEKLVAQYGGFICSDSEDFKPFYMGKH